MECQQPAVQASQPQHGAGEQKLIEIQISLKLDFNEKIIDNLGIRTQ